MAIKLIQALKQIKDLKRKSSDLQQKIKVYCADYNFETPTYGTAEQQKQQVSEWVQACLDIHKEILRLSVAIQKTNLATMVPIELGNKTVTKSITEWIHRRRELAQADALVWKSLTNRNLKEGLTKSTAGQEVEMKVRLYYDSKQRDEALNVLLSEPSIIDGHLEITNAVTDLIE